MNNTDKAAADTLRGLVLRGLLLVPWLLVSSLTVAADRQGNYAVWGLGSASCNQFVQGSDSPERTQRFQDFMMGYLTAVNGMTPDTGNVIGTMRLSEGLAWVREYCSEHRMDSFERSLSQLVLKRHTELTQQQAQGQTWGRAATAPAAPPQD